MQELEIQHQNVVLLQECIGKRRHFGEKLECKPILEIVHTGMTPRKIKSVKTNVKFSENIKYKQVNIMPITEQSQSRAYRHF